jgi:catechol-2,3-dioxygenase
MSNLGHAVFYVRDLERSVRFYAAAVGLGLCGTVFNGRAAQLSGGTTHHELLLIQVGEAPGPMQGKRVGLYHVGWKIGDSIEVLQALYTKPGERGYPLKGCQITPSARVSICGTLMAMKSSYMLIIRIMTGKTMPAGWQCRSGR